jgi:hypothetical protein
MSRSDLKELGEQLDAGQAGLVVVGVSDMQSKVEKAMTKASKIESREMTSDAKELESEAQEVTA